MAARLGASYVIRGMSPMPIPTEGPLRGPTEGCARRLRVLVGSALSDGAMLPGERWQGVTDEIVTLRTGLGPFEIGQVENAQRSRRPHHR